MHFSPLLLINLSTLALGAIISRDNTNDPQSSLSLDPSQVQTGLQQNGQQASGEAGQVPSLTSSNNFINFCLTQNGVPLTNGSQIVNGSCNPTPMGRILGKNVMPATKFLFPANLDTSLVENQTFTVQLIMTNLQTGFFANPETNFMAAPAQVNDKGHLVGHSHIVIQKIPSLNSTDVLDPREFAFFQGLNDPAENSILSANVTGGLPAGDYRIGSITTAANHQPALVAIAQHGMLDDMVYFTVQPKGGSSVSQQQSGTPLAKRNMVPLPLAGGRRPSFRFARSSMSNMY